MQLGKNGPSIRREFKAKANDKLRVLPTEAREKCEAIEQRSETVKSRVQKLQNKHYSSRVTRAYAKVLKEEGYDHNYNPPGGGPDPLMVRAKARVAKKSHNELARVDTAKRNMQNTVARKHHVVLHPEPSQKNQLKTSFSRAGR